MFMETSFGSIFVERYIQFGAGPVLNYSYFIPTFHHQIPTFSYFFLETIPTFFLLFHQRPLSSLLYTGGQVPIVRGPDILGGGQ